MNLTVIDTSSNVAVAEYVVPEISMLNFLGWKDHGEVDVPLHQLVETTARLSSVDPVAGTADTLNVTVDLFLPDYLQDGVRRQLEAQQAAVASSDQGSAASTISEVVEQSLSPPLKVSDILAAVVQEISQNHQPGNAFTVRVSDVR